MAKKFNKNILLWVIGILFVMSVMPGQGEKIAGDTQAITQSDIACTQDTDCPTCLGKGLSDFNESDPTFLGELSFSECNNEGFCDLSEFCITWSCGDTQENCESVKQTILDNTILKLRDNPMLTLLIGAAVVAFFML